MRDQKDLKDLKDQRDQRDQKELRLDSLQGFLLSQIPAQMTYHELEEVPVRREDLFEQLDRNLSRLVDLHARLGFVMREVRYQMKLEHI